MQLILKPDEDDKQIIALKGNNECLFYSDNVCRKGDRTRDCVNCARVCYHSLYKLNWDNQTHLWGIIDKIENLCSGNIANKKYIPIMQKILNIIDEGKDKPVWLESENENGLIRTVQSGFVMR